MVDYEGLAREILRRYENAEAEANITSAVRDFLIGAGLARADQIVEENPPAQTSRRAVDLTALDTFVEVKRRIGARAGFSPDARYVEQLDDYLDQSEKSGKRSRMGILTDGKYWLLRWPDAGAVKTALPYGFTLDARDGGGVRLYEWLRDRALVSSRNIPLHDRESVEKHFGVGNPHYEKDIARLQALYQRHKGSETVRVKRRLWDNLLRAALGEVAGTRRGLDDLFVRHTYLTAVIGLAVQATFRIDIAGTAEYDAEGLLKGRQLQNATGLHGIVESDFFAWPTEVEGGLPPIKTLARRIARFAWAKAPPDIGAMLYETVIPADERRQLGEYYTPAWLARVMVRELVEQPLDAAGAGPGVRLRHVRRGGGGALPGSRRGGRLRAGSDVGAAAGRGDRGGRASGGGASGARRVGAGGAAGDSGRQRRRLQRANRRAGLPGRRPAIALLRRPVRAAGRAGVRG